MIRVSLQILGGIPRRPESITLDNGETWRLEGECNQCGECCRRPGTPFDNNGTCAKLKFNTDENGETKAECSVYWNRPWTCLIWPRHPNRPLPEKCSLKWVRNEAQTT